MAPEERKIAFAVGVRDAKPLAYLPAALNGARAFFEWATALGYEAKLITDESEPVTVDRLRTELECLLDGDPRDRVPVARERIGRLVLYFAGHGLIREAEQGLWLLSDWSNSLRAVAVDPLKRRLALRDIKQIAIFSDSCRSLPRDMDAADLVPDAVLGRGPGSKGSGGRRGWSDPEVDKFVAAQDGEAAFAIPGETEDEDRCLFSAVLIEALWGMQPLAFSEDNKGRVTSRSLSRFLKDEVPKVAARYGRTSAPSTTPTFSEGEDVYYEKGRVITRAPFPAWPSPTSIVGKGPEARAVRESAAPVTQMSSASSRDDVELDAADPKEGQQPTFLDRLRLQPRPHGFETGSGFAAEGTSIRRVWTPGRVMAESHGGASWWRVREQKNTSLLESAPILIELVDGRCAAVTMLPGFIATVLCERHGVSALVYRPDHSLADVASDAEAAIDQLERGALRADAVSDIAAQLRREKHMDPVLGVISAYLYDSIGDVDSIRRIAYYYAQSQQPIPYDVALLAHLTTRRTGDQLKAAVPPVAARHPRTYDETMFRWTYESTPSTEGAVGGIWPWLRQGWAFLDDPVDDGSLVLPRLINLMGNLTPGRFTTLTAAGARELIAMLELVPRDPT